MAAASKFTVTVQVAPVVEAHPPATRFSVIDTGIGIAADDLPRLFTQFSQLDATPSRRYGGTGLGLAISRRLAEMMGGSIGVESVLGQGSCFHFTVPLRPLEDPPSGLAAAADAMGATNLNSIEYTGSGSLFGFGQAYLPGEPWPRFNQRNYTASINYQTPDPECDLDYVPNVAREMQVNAIVNNSFLGNASKTYARRRAQR